MVRLSEEEYQRLQNKGRPEAPVPEKPKARAEARDGELPERMNKTERRYLLEVLEPQRRSGQIREIWFESVNLRLGENTHYRPDFMVITAYNRIEFHEIKGAFIREDAMIKFKAAARMYPCFHWQMHQWKDGEWRLKVEL